MISRISVSETLEAYELTRNARDDALTLVFSAATAFIAPLAFSYFTASSLDAGETIVITATSIVTAGIVLRGALVAFQLSREMSDTVFLAQLSIPKHPRLYLLNRMLRNNTNAA